MKIAASPTRRQFKTAYESLLWDRRPPKISVVAKWARWSRLDARLAEIFVKRLVKSYREINPFLLWEENRKHPCPQAMAVLVDFAKIRAKSELSRPDRASFRLWAETVVHDLQPSPLQTFFVAQGMPHPRRDLADLEASMSPYLKWGFFGVSEIAPLKRPDAKRPTLLGRREREAILNRLLQSRTSLKTEDYVNACDGRVSARTAERDLKAHRQLNFKGNTRSRIYFKN